MKPFGRHISIPGWQRRAQRSWRQDEDWRIRLNESFTQPVPSVEAAQHPPLTLSRPPYLDAVVGLLKQEDSELWRWFASDDAQSQRAERVRLDLLKAAYRLEEAQAADLYRLAEVATAKMSLDVSVTFYQAHQFVNLNAVTTFVPGEAHIVFHGPLRDHMNEDELLWVLSHELAHVLLWNEANRDYLYADQLLSALTWEENDQQPYRRTAHLFARYIEVFADRVALTVSENLAAAISALVKLNTQITSVDVDAYLRQTQEIVSSPDRNSAGSKYPETHVRAYAMQMWLEDSHLADAQVARQVEGPLTLGDLDLLAQRQLQTTTRQLWQHILQPEWTHTEAVLAHARLFFDDADTLTHSAVLPRPVEFEDIHVRDYLSYVLLDFVTTDRDLDPSALRHAIQVAGEWGLLDQFREIAIRELRLRKRQFEEV